MAVAGQRGRGGGAPAGVALKVALRLGVALRSVRAAVYFQEQFLDGGWAGVGVSGGRWGSHWLRRCVRPNICGSETKKVHVILNYKNKHHPIKKPIRCKADRYTHLYTLIIRPDQTYDVKIDNKMVASGNLEDDFDFLPPRKVNDPTVRKPTDWDDRMQIDDPKDIKPEDWDEAEFITDTSAEKPEDPRCCCEWRMALCCGQESSVQSTNNFVILAMDNTLSNFSLPVFRTRGLS